MTITAAPAETLTLRCDVCKKPVADQTGYLCVDEIAALCEVPGGSQSGSRRTPARSSTAGACLSSRTRSAGVSITAAATRTQTATTTTGSTCHARGHTVRCCCGPRIFSASVLL